MSDNKTNVPRHVAIILDGNGRWAKKRFLPRAAGHSAGAKTVEDVCEWAWDLGIKYLTVYAFSTENWKRSEDEVKTLMNLLRDYLKNCLIRSRKNNMRVRVIGDKSRLAPAPVTIAFRAAKRSLISVLIRAKRSSLTKCLTQG